jgi:threonine/homoserine/homoserine lactone efflux protein
VNIFLFVKSVILGFAIAAPLGPVNILCMQRTLAHGRKIGWLSGAGAALADGVYAAAAVFGLGLVSGFLARSQVWLQVAGGIILLLLGARVVAAHVSTQAAEPPKISGHASAFASMFLFNLLSPVTLATYAGAIVGLSGVWRTGGGLSDQLMIVFGVMAGSLAWVTIWIMGAHKLKTVLSKRWLRAVNLVVGAALAGLGAFSLWSAF